MYADKITASMQKTIDETDYRRTKQINFNTANNQVPQALNKIEVLLPRILWRIMN
jgi:excinuclease ABC subunit B